MRLRRCLSRTKPQAYGAEEDMTNRELVDKARKQTRWTASALAHAVADADAGTILGLSETITQLCEALEAYEPRPPAPKEGDY